MHDTPSTSSPTQNTTPQNGNSSNQKKNAKQHGLLNVAQALAASAQRTPEADTRKWSKKNAVGATPIPFNSVAPVLSLPVELLAHLLAFFDPASLAVAQRGLLPIHYKFQPVKRRIRSLPALEIRHRGRAQLARCFRNLLRNTLSRQRTRSPRQKTRTDFVESRIHQSSVPHLVSPSHFNSWNRY